MFKFIEQGENIYIKGGDDKKELSVGMRVVKNNELTANVSVAMEYLYNNMPDNGNKKSETRICRVRIKEDIDHKDVAEESLEDLLSEDFLEMYSWDDDDIFIKTNDDFVSIKDYMERKYERIVDANEFPEYKKVYHKIFIKNNNSFVPVSPEEYSKIKNEKKVLLVANALLKKGMSEKYAKLHTIVDGKFITVREYLVNNTEKQPDSSSILLQNFNNPLLAKKPEFNLPALDSSLGLKDSLVSEYNLAFSNSSIEDYMEEMKTLSSSISDDKSAEENLAIVRKLKMLYTKVLSMGDFWGNSAKILSDTIADWENIYQQEINNNIVARDGDRITVKLRVKQEAIDELCMPIDEKYLKIFVEYSIDEMVPQFRKLYNGVKGTGEQQEVKGIIDLYKDIKKIAVNMPELLSVFREQEPKDETVKDAEFLFKDRANSITLEYGRRKLRLPIIKNNGNANINFTEELRRCSFPEAAEMLKQLTYTYMVFTNALEYLKENESELLSKCEERREKLRIDAELKEQEAKAAAERAKIEAAMLAKAKEFDCDDGVWFSFGKAKELPRKEAERTGVKKNNNKAKTATPVKSRESEGSIEYKKVDPFSSFFNEKISKILGVEKYIDLSLPENSEKMDKFIELIRPKINIEKILSSPVSYKTKFTPSTEFTSPTNFVAFHKRLGLVEVRRLDGEEVAERGLHPNSRKYAFKDIGPEKDTERKVELLTSEYGIDEMIASEGALKDVLDGKYDKHPSEAIYLKTEKGALQASVVAKEMLGYSEANIKAKAKAVRSHFVKLSNLDKDGFSIYGINVVVRTLKDTIDEIIKERKAAHLKLSSQIEEFKELGITEAKEVEETLELVARIPEHINGKLWGKELDIGGANKPHVEEFLQFWDRHYQQLASQIKVNEAKLIVTRKVTEAARKERMEQVGYLINEYADATPEDRKLLKELAREMPCGDELCSILDSIV